MMQDTLVKRRLYAAAGVPEYWIVNPAAQTFEFLHLSAGDYEAQSLDADGRYRSKSLPGLSCDPMRLWLHEERSKGRYRDDNIFAVESEHGQIGARTDPNDDETWEWEWRPLALPIGRRPSPITFDQLNISYRKSAPRIVTLSEAAAEAKGLCTYQCRDVSLRST